MQKSDWKKCKLSDIADVRDGTHDSPKQETSGGFPLVTSRHISNGKVNLNDTYNISEKDFNAINIRSKVDRGDILISMIGTVGQIAYVDEIPIYAIKNIGLIKPNKLDSSKYLFYYLKSPIAQEDILSRLKGTTQQYLSLGELRNFPIYLPPLEEQKRIADILGAFDDKIELLQKQNKTLEDMAKAIFKSWFVDFDIVKAKQQGHPKADIIREYHLTQELYDLFPSDFENSSLGPIPLGWQVKTVQEIANITIGRTPPRKETEWFSTNSSDVTWISIKDLGNGSVFISDSSEYLTQEAVSKFRIPIIPAKTVVLSFKLTVGRVAITTKNMCSNEAIAQFQDSSLPITYLYLLLKHINFSLLGSTSSIATAINSNTIKNMNMLVATKGILLAFDNQTQYLFNKIEENLKQIQTLTELRDTLLPPLISGKIRV